MNHDSLRAVRVQRSLLAKIEDALGSARQRRRVNLLRLEGTQWVVYAAADGSETHWGYLSEASA